MEEHLEKRAKLLDLINQFKEKQEAITNSHISQLHVSIKIKVKRLILTKYKKKDVLNFLGNIKAAKTDIDMTVITKKVNMV